MSELPGDSKSLPAQKVIDKTQWVKFNVGGCMLETTRKTVDKLQSSFLDLLLDNEIQEITNPLPEGVFRIDRDPEVFQILLNYGRYGRITGVPDHVTLEFVLQEVEFYKMSHHVRDAVLNFFEQKRKGPNGIRVESVSITETTFKRKHKHHNSYGILGGGATISCYSSIPGGGTCYADVSSLFQYEKPHSKCKLYGTSVLSTYQELNNKVVIYYSGCAHSRECVFLNQVRVGVLSQQSTRGVAECKHVMYLFTFMYLLIDYC